MEPDRYQDDFRDWSLKSFSAPSKALALTALVSLSINSIVLPAIAQDSSDKLDLRPPIKSGSEDERTDDLSADKLEDKAYYLNQSGEAYCQTLRCSKLLLN
ncbi:MAG: hypothetical protein R3C24_17280 [Cyanobacteriota/Melainabacteria group bacterium]